MTDSIAFRGFKHKKRAAPNNTNVISVFDPATLSLTGWWRASFDGSPWRGTASLGASSGRNLSEASVPPAIGSALNSLTSANFDGTDDQISSAIDISSYFDPSAGSGWALVYNRTNDKTSWSSGGHPYSNRTVWSNLLGSAAFGLFFDAVSGAGIGFYDGSYKAAVRPCSINNYHLIVWRWNGSILQIGVDERPGAAGGLSSVSVGPASSLSGIFQVGIDGFQLIFLDGNVYELGVSNTVFSDTTFDNIKSYTNSRYALSL